MKFKINSIILLGLVIVFSTLNLLDFVTALFILPAESNPVFLVTGSIWWLFLLKLCLSLTMFFVYYYNKYPSELYYFMFVYVLLIGSLVLLFGIGSNVYGILNPEIVVAGSDISVSDKMTYYFTIMTIMFIIPYIISLLSFKLYQITKPKIVIKGNIK